MPKKIDFAVKSFIIQIKWVDKRYQNFVHETQKSLPGFADLLPRMFETLLSFTYDDVSFQMLQLSIFFDFSCFDKFLLSNNNNQLVR